MNGVDDDENSKLDDCLGWDFVGNDNDPASNSASEYQVHTLLYCSVYGKWRRYCRCGARSKVMSIKFYGGSKWTSTKVLN